MQVSNLIRPSLSRKFLRDPSLLLYLPFYKLDGATFQSHDAYGHLVTRTGVTFGLTGGTWDGVDDFTSVPSKTIFDVTDISIELWIKWTGSGTTFIFERGGNEWGIQAASDGVKTDLRWIPLTGATHDTADGTFTPNVWHHVVITYVSSGSVAHIYIDGVDLSLTSVGTGNLATSVEPLVLGQRSAGGTHFWFKGMVREFWIYGNRVLTLAEVQNNRLATMWGYA